MILDLGLPDLDGLDVIREVHEREPTLPIIVLSARASSGDKVTALDLGADDYVTKPFDMNELLARLRAASGEPAGTRLARSCGSVTMRSTCARTVSRSDGPQST